MRMNIMLDDVLPKKAMALSSVKTKSEVLTCALQEFV